MGGSNSKNVENIVNVTSKSILNAATKVSNTCSLESNNIQDMTFKVSNSDIISQCLEKYSPSECNLLKISGVDINNINQTLASKIVGECQFDNSVAAELASEISNEISQKMDKETDAFGEAMVDMVNALNNTEANTINKQDIQTAVENNISVDFVNEMITDIKNRQKMYFDIGGVADDLNFANISQEASVEAFLKVAAKNENLTKATTAVENKADQEASNKQKGLTDMLESLTGMFSNPFVIIGLVICFIVMAFVGLQGFKNSKYAK